MSSDNETVSFLRSDHFTKADDKSQKSLLEMALTRALVDPTLGATSGGWFIYDDKKSTVIEKTSKSAAALAAEGFELDHVFERQFLSGLIVHVMGAQDPPMSTINDLLHIANLPENLVWIRKDLHDLKSSVFGRTMAEFDARLCTYLTQCQLMFVPALDKFSTSREVVKSLIRAIKETPWYLGHWDGFKGFLPKGEHRNYAK